MKRVLLSFIIVSSLFNSAKSQDVILNGKIDNLLEFCTPFSEEFIMSDSVKLMTDVYLPVMRNCLLVPISIDLPSELPLRRRRPKAGSTPNESVAPLNCDDESLRLAVAIATARFALCVLGSTCWSLKQRRTHLVGNCTVISDSTPSLPTLV